MSSLYKRATPSQARILRAVEGAVRNAAHAHPEKAQGIDAKMARSIAKRAAGTLTAQWPDVLAARCVPSDRESGRSTDSRSTRASENSGTARGLRRPDNKRQGMAAGTQPMKSRPLVLLWRQLKREMWAIKKSGNVERERAFIDVLRMVAKLQQAQTPKGG